MATAIEGTPTRVASGGSYTAETTGTNRVAAFVVHTDLSGTSDNVTALTFGAQSATKIVESNPTNNSGTASIWYIRDADIPTGSQTVTPTLSGGTLEDCTIDCYTLSDVDQTTPSIGSDSAVSTGNSTTVSFTSLATVASGLAIGGANFQEFANRTWTPPTSWTEDVDAGSLSLSACSAHYATSGATESGSWTMDSSRNGTRICAVAAFQPAAAGGVTGTGAFTSTQVALSGSAVLEHTGLGSLSVASATLSGSAKKEFSASGDIQVSIPTISGTGTLSSGKTGSGNLPTSQVELSGSAVLEHTGSGAFSVSSIALSGSGKRELIVSGGFQVTAPTISGTGLQSAPGTITGSGNLSAGNAAISGTATLEHTASGTLSIVNAEIAGSSVLEHSVAGGMSAPVSELSGTATIPVEITCTGSFVAPVIQLSGRQQEEAKQEYSGGFYFWLKYEQEMERRKAERRERQRLIEAAEEAADEIENALIEESRKEYSEQERKKELERLTDIADKYRKDIKKLPDSVIISFDRAIEKRTFSAMEALERELARVKEEEEFLIEATYLMVG